MEQQQDARQQVDAFRNAVVTLAVEEELDFNVIFTALSQITVAFIFDFLLLTKGELTEDDVDAALTKFGIQAGDVALQSFEVLKAAEKSQIIVEA